MISPSIRARIALLQDTGFAPHVLFVNRPTFDALVREYGLSSEGAEAILKEEGGSFGGLYLHIIDDMLESFYIGV